MAEALAAAIKKSKVESTNIERRGMWINKDTGTVSFGLGCGVNEVAAICVPATEYDAFKAFDAEALEKSAKALTDSQAEIAKLQKANDGFIAKVNEITTANSLAEEQIAKLREEVKNLTPGRKVCDNTVGDGRSGDAIGFGNSAETGRVDCSKPNEVPIG